MFNAILGAIIATFVAIVVHIRSISKIEVEIKQRLVALEINENKRQEEHKKKMSDFENFKTIWDGKLQRQESKFITLNNVMERLFDWYTEEEISKKESK